MKRALILMAMICLAALAVDDAVIAPKAATSRKPQAASYGAEAITIPQMLSYQGRLTDTLGMPVADTTYSLKFRLYTVPSGGSPFWGETQLVRTRGGLFSTLLGLAGPIDSMPDAGAAYLGMTVGVGAELTPRLRIASAAYAFLARRADTANYALAGGGGSGDNAWVRGTPDSVLYTVHQLGITRGGAGNELYGNMRQTHTNLGVACTTGTSGQNYGYATVGGGRDNAASGHMATVGGGTNNLASGMWATIGGGYGNRAPYASATVGGGIDNAAWANSTTVGGGEANSATSQYATVAGGYSNTASGGTATVSGGTNNLASGQNVAVGGGTENTASGPYSTVGGGLSDTASAQNATVGGGYDNVASGTYATVSGGTGNTASGQNAAVSGGSGNLAPYNSATVGGGTDNAAWANYTTVAGGYVNSATGQSATVAGGSHNTASSQFATVSGGYDNAASGEYATVAGGVYDTSAALASFTTNDNSMVPSGFDNSAAFNGQRATASNQTRVGALSKASGTFTIDHPLDPQGKILNHYFIEGPEMLNIYRGSVVLDGSGRAVVALPDYFDALNRNPMVQLTGVGSSDVYVAEKTSGNRFAIGGRPGTEVYLQVTGERQDVSAEITRRLMPVEQPKTGVLAGTMLDDDFLRGAMDQLVREGKAQGIDFRTAAGRQRYEEMKRRLLESQAEDGR